MVDSTVVALPGYSVPSDQPVERVVEILTDALELARQGQIVGVAVVAAYKQPPAFGNEYHGEHMSRHALAAGVLALSHMIAKDLIADD